MKKINLLAAMFLCVFGGSVLYGVGLTESASHTSLGDGAISDDSSTTVRRKTDNSKAGTSKVSQISEQKKSGNTGGNGATLPNGTAYVGVDSTLSIRDNAEWGNIVGQLVNNQEVTITGREGDWYKITSSAGDGYVHSRYIFSAKDQKYEGNDVYAPVGSNGGSNGSGVNYTVSGDSVQGKVVAAAEYLVETYKESGSFPYDPLTNGGNLGCAQVVSTALKAAGVVPNVDLSCYGVMGMLQNAGWQTVSAPPFQAGDCIFWSTYDSDGDGQKDPNTHIGLIMDSGNSVQAMSNSSSEHRPRYHDPFYAPITTVMRKC